MENRQASWEMGGNILNHIEEGFKVYDRDGEEVGIVEDVYLGSVSDAEEMLGRGPATTDTPAGAVPDDTIFHDIAEGFTPDRDLPEVVVARLRREGFLRVDDGGWFDEDLFVFRNQIDAVNVSERKVRLSVTRKEIIDEDLAAEDLSGDRED